MRTLTAAAMILKKNLIFFGKCRYLRLPVASNTDKASDKYDRLTVPIDFVVKLKIIKYSFRHSSFFRGVLLKKFRLEIPVSPGRPGCSNALVVLSKNIPRKPRSLPDSL